MSFEHDTADELEAILTRDAALLGASATPGLEDRVHAASVRGIRELRLVGTERPQAGRGPGLITPLRIAACIALGAVSVAVILAMRTGTTRVGPLAEVTPAVSAQTPGVDPEIDALLTVALGGEDGELKAGLRQLRADAARIGERLHDDDEPFLAPDDEGSM